jgi:hypothetical protein
MKKHFINAFVALGMLATLSSCAKEEQTDLKPVKTMAHPLDPGNYGYYQVVIDENYFYNDSVSTFARPTANYLKMKPLSLEKYKNGSLLDSVCNQDLALHFEGKALKTHPKSALWGAKPYVENEHPPLLTLNSTNPIITIKMSKMLTGFGLELNSYYQELNKRVGINISLWNSKLNKMVEHSGGTRYLQSLSFEVIPYGLPGGARLDGLNGKEEFDEVRIRFEYNPNQPPPPIGPFEVYVTGFRYVLAK